MSQPTITAIIVNFNSGDFLKRAVVSARSTDLCEAVVVVDNASSDNSLERVICADEVSILRNCSNLGFAVANNQGLKLVNSDFVLFLNPDCEVTKDSISALVKALKDTPNAGMVGPLILNEDGSEQRGCRRSEPTPGLVFKTLFGRRDRGVNQVGDVLPDEPIEVDAISGACMLVRREALDDVGLMDEGYFLHFEDLDWCKRFWLRGWKVMFVPDAVITHYKGGSSRSRPVRVEWHKHKGMVRYYRKFYHDKYPKPLMWLTYGAVWARFIIMMPIWWLKGFSA